MNLKEWQSFTENKVSCNEISKTRLFTVMRDKTNELQERIEFLENLNMRFADKLTAYEVIELLGESK